MNKNAPEIVALRQRIEQKLGRAVNSPTEFTALSTLLRQHLNETVSSTTLKRLWGYVDGTDKTRESTLRILSNFLGYRTFNEFCGSLTEDDAFQSGWVNSPSVSVSDLHEGDEVEVAWLPNRLCRFRFEGGLAFVVVLAEHSKLQVGDRFECAMFIQGVPMYLNNFCRGDQAPVAFVAGLKDGLTSVKVIRAK